MEIVDMEKAIKASEETYLWALARMEHSTIMSPAGIGHFVSDRRENLEILRVVSEQIGHSKVSPRILDMLREIDGGLSVLEKVPEKSEDPREIKRAIELMAKVHSLSFGAELYLSPLATPTDHQGRS